MLYYNFWAIVVAQGRNWFGLFAGVCQGSLCAQTMVSLFALDRCKLLSIVGFAVSFAGKKEWFAFMADNGSKKGTERRIRRDMFKGVRRSSSRACEAGVLFVVCSFIVLLVIGGAL